MFCKNCGNEVNSSEKFCGNCGASIVQTDQSFKEIPQPKWEMKSPFENTARNKADGSIQRQGKRITLIVAGLVAIMAVCFSLLFMLSGGDAPPVSQTEGNREITADEKAITVESIIAVDKAMTVGNAAKNGAALDVPVNAFDEDVNLTLKTLSSEDSKAMQSKDFELFGMPVAVEVEGKETVRLNQPAVISITIPKNQLASINNPDDVYAGYYNGRSWEYFLPDSVDLKKGLVKFSTYHFSPFGAGKLSEKEQIERFAKQMAVQSWAKSKTEQDFIDATRDYFKEAFTKLGIQDSTSQGKLLRSIVKEEDFGTLLVSLEGNNTVDFASKLSEMTGKVLLNKFKLDPDFIGNSASIAGTAAKAAGYLAGGDSEAAMKEIASGMMDFFPAGRAMKAAVEMVDAGINDWTDSEIETAYQAYKNGAVKERGYDVTKGNFEELITQMKGISHKIYSDAIKKYCEKYGVKENDLSKSTLAQIRRDAENKLKMRFEKRMKAETEIQKQKDYHAKIIQAFKKFDLLKRGSFGFAVEDNIEDRLQRLYNVMENIREMVGSDIPMEDMCVLIGSWYNDKTKDKSAFYAKMKELGYPKEAAKPTTVTKPTAETKQPASEKPEAKKPAAQQPDAASKEYTWVLVEVVDFKKDEAVKAYNKSYEGVYEYTHNYSRGSITDGQKYIGKTDTYPDPDMVHGEGIKYQFNWSPPPEVIKKDQVVTLNISLSVLDNTLSYYGFNGSMDVYFDTESVARGGGRTRGAIHFVNQDDKYHFQISNKNKFQSISETVSATPKSGSKPGDRMALIAHGGMHGAHTGYIYEWKEI